MVGGQGDDEHGAEGERDLEQGGLPVQGVVGVQGEGALGGGEEALDGVALGVAEAVPDQVPHAGARLLLALEEDDRAGAEHGDDPPPQAQPPVGAVGADDMNRQAQRKACEPQQGIGEGQVVVVGGREHEADRQPGNEVQQHVDLVAEDAALGGRGIRLGGGAGRPALQLQAHRTGGQVPQPPEQRQQQDGGVGVDQRNGPDPAVGREPAVAEQGQPDGTSGQGQQAKQGDHLDRVQAKHLGGGRGGRSQRTELDRW